MWIGLRHDHLPLGHGHEGKKIEEREEENGEKTKGPKKVKISTTVGE